jgi:hypothetical protein
MDIMKSKNLALLTGVTCIAVLATYAWAATQEVTEVKVEEAVAKVEEAAEPERLCIPMSEAAEATAANDDSSEAKTEESSAEETKSEESTDEAKSEEGDAEVALPLCDEEGNPPVAEEAASEEKTEEAAKEPVKTE